MRADGLFVHTKLDALDVLIAAERVQRIAEPAEAEQSDMPRTDLARVFGLDEPDAPRRALALEVDGRVGWLVVGAHVAIRKIPEEGFIAIPDWLASISGRLPLAGLVALDDRFAFELDARRLMERVSA